jgi:hypothetical protein
MARLRFHSPHFVNPSETHSAATPRYIEHPARKRAWRAARRNLGWGVAFLIAALGVLGVALMLGGPRAILPLVFVLLSFTTLWVLARLKVFAQRNGVFFSLAVVALLGAGAALIEQMWVQLAPRFEVRRVEPKVALSPPSEATSMAPGGGIELPFLSDALGLEAPDPALPRVRANRDFTTSIAGKTYRVRAGETFLFADEKAGEIYFSAGEFLARVPGSYLSQLAPSPSGGAAAAKADPALLTLEQTANAQITARSQAEAARRFPGLARKDSPENRAYIQAYQDLKARESELLEDPEWPLHLAEMLAQRMGWEEMGVIEARPAIAESRIAPGTRVLDEAAPADATAPQLAPAPEAEPEPEPEPDIPPPPQVPPQ